MYTYHLNLQRSTPTRKAVPSDRLPARTRYTQSNTRQRNLSRRQLRGRAIIGSSETVAPPYRPCAMEFSSSRIEQRRTVLLRAQRCARRGIGTCVSKPRHKTLCRLAGPSPARLGTPAGRLPPGSTVNSALNASTGYLLRRGHEFGRIFPFLVRLLLSLYEPTAPTPSRIQTTESPVTGRKTAMRTDSLTLNPETPWMQATASCP
jgi:hypothetical protein